jgi:hypothetical protein
VAIGDLDRDGALDIVATSYDAVTQRGFASVLFGDGGGAFGPPDSYETDYYFAYGPILADLDGNGLLDLAVASRNANSVMVFRAPERGELLRSSVRYGTGDSPRSMAAGDLDGDGDLDLAVACSYSGDVVILPGKARPVDAAAGDATRRDLWPVGNGRVAAAPNPFREATRVRFDLPGDFAATGLARVDVYDVAGRRVRTLSRGARSPVRDSYEWDGRDALGRPVGSGVYFVRLEVAGSAVATRKVVRTR